LYLTLIMLPRSYNSFNSGPKSPLARA
jgi:hypothetical protein